MARVAYSERFARYGVNITEDPRITRNKLVTLRTKQTQDEEVNTKRKMFQAILTDLQGLISSLLYVEPKKPHTMCRYYGHVIKGSWSGERPHCGDCGARIESPSELRTAAPRA